MTSDDGTSGKGARLKKPRDVRGGRGGSSQKKVLALLPWLSPAGKAGQRKVPAPETPKAKTTLPRSKDVRSAQKEITALLPWLRPAVGGGGGKTGYGKTDQRCAGCDSASGGTRVVRPGAGSKGCESCPCPGGTCCGGGGQSRPVDLYERLRRYRDATDATDR